MKLSIISIGNELLIGQVVNTNAAWLGQHLSLIGWEVSSVVCISDDYDTIQRTVDRAFHDVDVVITTGGLGPTKDDVTKKAIADHFGCEMVFHNETWERISAYFNARNYPISEAHRQQCYMPDGADVYVNDLGTAPGLRLEKGQKHCIMLPGVPYEMKHLMKQHVVPFLTSINSVDAFHQLTFYTAGTGETVIADHIADFEDQLPEGASLAYLPAIGQVRVRLSMLNIDRPVFDEYCNQLRDLLRPWYYGEGHTSLEEEVARLFHALGLKLVLAESCTGGLISAKLVSLPGVSHFYLGGAVVYSYEHKSSVLGVPSELIESQGAVSEDVVVHMVKGALKHLGGDVAAAVSGIAGPAGGTDDKPVGTTWIAVGNNDKVVTKKIVFNKDRQRNIEFSAVTALNMIRKFLIDVYLK